MGCLSSFADMINRRGWEKVLSVRKPATVIPVSPISPANPFTPSPSRIQSVLPSHTKSSLLPTTHSLISSPNHPSIPFRIRVPNFDPWLIPPGFIWADYANIEVILPPGFNGLRVVAVPANPFGVDKEEKEEKEEKDEVLLMEDEPINEPVISTPSVPEIKAAPKSKRSFKPRKMKRIHQKGLLEQLHVLACSEESSTKVDSSAKVGPVTPIDVVVTAEVKQEQEDTKLKVKGNGFIVLETPKVNRKTKRKELKRSKPVAVETPMKPVKETLFYQRSVTLFRFTYPFQHLSTIEIRQCANLSKLGYLKLITILGILKETDLLREFSLAYKLFDYVSSVSTTEFYALMISCIDIIPQKRTDETKIKFTQLIQKSKIQAVRNFEAVMERKDCPVHILNEAQHLVETEFQLTRFAENMFMTPKKPKDMLFTQVGVFVPGNCKLHSCSVCYRMRQTQVQLCSKCKTSVCSEGCKQKASPIHKCLGSNVESMFYKNLMGGTHNCLRCGVTSTEQLRCRCVLTIVLHQLMFLQENGFLYSECLSLVSLVLEYTDLPPMWSENLFTVWPALVNSDKDNQVVLQILKRDEKSIKSCPLATCGHCNSASYCSQECLTEDQKTHGPECSTIQKNAWPVLVDSLG